MLIAPGAPVFVRQDVPHHKVNGDSGRPTQIAVAKFEKDEKDEIGTKVSAQAKDNGEHNERFNTPTREATSSAPPRSTL